MEVLTWRRITIQLTGRCQPWTTQSGLNRRRGVGAPLHRQAVEDHSRARQVAGSGDHLRRSPAVRLHDSYGIAGVLNRISGVGFDKNRRLRNALRLRGSRHHPRLNILIAHSAASQDQPRSHPPLILMHSFVHTGQLLGRGVAVAVCRVAQHNNGVKAGERSIRYRRKQPSDGPPAKQAGNQQDGGQNQSASPAEAPPSNRLAACQSAGRRLARSGLDGQRNSPASTLTRELGNFPVRPKKTR